LHAWQEYNSKMVAVSASACTFYLKCELEQNMRVICPDKRDNAHKIQR